jgi:hypothetical protein
MLRYLYGKNGCGYTQSAANVEAIIENVFPHDVVHTPYLYASSVGSLGCDSAIGEWCRHLSQELGKRTQVASSNSSNYAHRIECQLQKYGIQAEDLTDLYESLLDAAGRYGLNWVIVFIV